MASIFQNAKKIFSVSPPSGGSSLSGLTTNYLTKATSTSTIGDSVVYESGGNVGINTITPTSKLHIIGQDSTSGTYNLKLENQSLNPLFYSRNDGLHSMGTTIANGVRFNIKAIGNVGSGNEVLRLDNDVNGRIAVFRNDGYVGLGGITLPTAILHAKGSDSTSSNYSLKIDNSASSPLFYVRNDGNVGIGTTTPVEKLSIKASNLDGLGVYNTSNQRDVWMFASTDDGGSLRGFKNNVEGFVFTSATYPSFINNGQNFGIGTSSPLANLDVTTTAVGTDSSILVNSNLANASITLSSSKSASSSSYASSLYFKNFNILKGSLILDSIGNGTVVLSSHNNAVLQMKNQSTGEAVYLGDGGIYFQSTLGNMGIYNNSGNMGIGTISPTSKLQVVGLSTYADNAAAITAGLTVGAFYIRTGHGLDVVV